MKPPVLNLSTAAPSRCTSCGYPAYLGLYSVECTNFQCAHFHKDTCMAHIREVVAIEDAKKEESQEETQGCGKWGFTNMGFNGITWEVDS